jgi:AraC family transcriptional regulator, regulatory protein of adaptative response / methylated-DNA-[protein]-cysteine methyltransferase
MNSHAMNKPLVSIPTEMDPRWVHLIARDRTADGEFYYSVATTSVYCRPSCASRLANPKNVRFHDSIADAEAAGFRACRRCKPDQPAAEVQNVEMVVRARRLMEQAEETPTFAELAHAAGLSRHYFHRIFKAVTGVTPKAYAEAHRAGRVRDQLGRSNTITEAIYDAGFN